MTRTNDDPVPGCIYGFSDHKISMLSHLPGAMFEELIFSILRNGSRGELATKHSTVALKHGQVPWDARSRHPWLAEAGPVCQY